MLSIVKDSANRKKFLVLFIMCCVFVCCFYRLTMQFRLDDYVAFSNLDAIDYQLIAVNALDGYGFTAHFNEEYYRYKIGVKKSYLKEFAKDWDYFHNRFRFGTDLHVWKPPGYPFFLMRVYKWGISPHNVKLIQVILLSMAASFMPLVGFLYWGEIGILSGMISALMFINFYSPDPSEIMSESLYIFLFAIWILLFSIWDKRCRDIFTAFLGIISGVSLLVKGSCVFVPVFFLVYLFFKLRCFSYAFKHAFLFVFFLIITIMPWSLYASMRTHSPVLLCSQTMQDVLAGNNEQSIRTGEWSPKEGEEYYRRLYKKLETGGRYSEMRMLAFFFSQNYKHIPELLINKLKVAFYQDHIKRQDLIGDSHPSGIFWVIISTLLYYGIAFSRRDITCNQGADPPVFPLIFFTNILLVTLFCYGLYRVVLPFVYPLLIPAAYLPFYLVKILTGYIRAKT